MEVVSHASVTVLGPRTVMLMGEGASKSTSKIAMVVLSHASFIVTVVETGPVGETVNVGSEEPSSQKNEYGAYPPVTVGVNKALPPQGINGCAPKANKAGAGVMEKV